jgi:hypothetical protein
MRRARPVTGDVLVALDSWRETYPQFAEIWDAADPEMRFAFLRWMSRPRLALHRRDRVRTTVRESILNGKLQYSKVTLSAIAWADASLGGM